MQSECRSEIELQTICLLVHQRETFEIKSRFLFFTWVFMVLQPDFFFPLPFTLMQTGIGTASSWWKTDGSERELIFMPVFCVSWRSQFTDNFLFLSLYYTRACSCSIVSWRKRGRGKRSGERMATHWLEFHRHVQACPTKESGCGSHVLILEFVSSRLFGLISKARSSPTPHLVLITRVLISSLLF